MTALHTGPGRAPFLRALQGLALAGVAALLSACASTAPKTATLEAPPLLIEVPAPAGASAADGAPATKSTTVASLEELVAVVEPAHAPGAASAAAHATGGADAPRPRTGSALVPARLIERGELPALPQFDNPPEPPAPAAVPAAIPASRPASSGANPDHAIGPLVAPPLAGSAAAPQATAANAVGGPTDSVEPGSTVRTDDAQAHTDLWERVRGNFAIPDMSDALVRNHERWYAARPDYVQRMTERGSRYMYHIVEEVTRRGMPAELALLPFIESAYNPQAMSVAKASGMWQFIPSTGRDFALKQNVFRDDRRDVLASTRAALDYLGKLYGMFGDWRLALAAYNWGEGNVARAIARNQRAHKSTRYEDLKMPAETRNYVPKLQAVKNIVRAPEQFGLSLPELRNHPYFLSVPLYRDIDVDLAAQLALLDIDEFRSLNPSMDKPVILAAGTPQVLLPYDNADEFVRNLAAYTGPLASWTAWQLPRTVKLAEAAKIIGASEEVLRTVNNIPPRVLIKAGSVLLVPRDDDHQGDVSGHMAEHAQMLLQPDGPLLRRVVYRAARGDNVGTLARRYRVAPADLAQWNKVAASSGFSAGQQVVIYVPSTTTKVARGPIRKRGSGAHAGKPGSKPAAKAVRSKSGSRTSGTPATGH